MYFVASKSMDDYTEEIDEFAVRRINTLSDIADREIEKDIYKTICYEQEDIFFVTEMIDENGYFNSIELKTNDYYLFLTVCSSFVVVHTSNGENIKHLMYPHQFGNLERYEQEDYFPLFS